MISGQSTSYEVKFGADVTISYTLADGYAFKAWSSDLVEVGASEDLSGTGTIAEMPAENTTINLEVTALPADFIVVYMFETFTDGVYSETDELYPTRQTQVLSNYTDNIIESLDEYELRTFEGFAYRDFEKDVVVTSDGLAEVEVYLRRLPTTINITLGAGVESLTLSVNEQAGTIDGEQPYIIEPQAFTNDGELVVKFNADVTITYTLEGGYENISFSGVVVTEVTPGDNSAYTFKVPANTVNLVASAGTENTTITFHGNGGTHNLGGTDNTIYTQTVEYLSRVTLMSNAFTREGYAFEGWATADSLDEPELNNRIVYRDGEIFEQYPNYENLDLYAVWSNNTYSITYNGNGGSVAQTEGDPITEIAHGVEISYDTVVTLKSIDELGFKFTGRTFIGWTTDKNGTTSEAITDVASKEEIKEKGIYLIDGIYYAYNLASNKGDNVILNAVWREHTYTVTYNSNYTSKDVDATDDTYNEEDNVHNYTERFNAVSITDTGFALTGYTFDRWNTESDGSGRWIRAGEEVWSLTSEDNGEVILYAQWTANTYEIAYNGNGGTGEMTATPATYDQVITLSANGFGYNAYTFAGWTTEEDGTTSNATLITSTTEITESGLYYIVGENSARTYYAYNLTAEANGTANIYAVWTATSYNITYDANGGTFGASVKGAEGEEYVLPYTIEDDITFLTDITLTGYTLVGYTISGNSIWTGAFGGEIRFADSENGYDAGTLYGNVTLEAIWQINSHTLTINYVYGESHNYGEVISTYSEEWNYNSTYSITSPTNITGYSCSAEQATIAGTMPDEDVTVTVYYYANEIEITFNYMDDSVNSPATEFAYDTLVVKYDYQFSTARIKDVEGEEGVVGLADGVRNGYTFLGWWTTENYQTGTQVLATDFVTTTNNITLFAQWTANNDTPYTINLLFENLNDNGYSAREGYSAISEGVVGTTDKIPVEDDILGYINTAYETITGFTYDSYDQTPIRVGGTTVINVYFTRDYNTLTLSADYGIENFDANYDTTIHTGDVEYIRGSNGTVEVRFETVIVLSVEAREGYQFTSYTTTGIEPTAIDTENKFTMIDGNVTITAGAEARDYEIRYFRNYNLEDANYETATGTYAEDETLATVDELGFALTGYTFLGWSTSREGGVEYAGGEIFTMDGAYDDIVELYAVWKAGAVTLSITTSAGINKDNVLVYINDSVEGVSIGDIDSVRYDDEIRIDATNAVMTGYDFDDFVLNTVAQNMDELVLTFTLTGNTTVEINATPKTDSQLMIVYALRNLENTEFEIVGEPSIIGGPGTDFEIATDRPISSEFMIELGVIDSESGDDRFEGFYYTSVTDNLQNEASTGFTVIYNTNIAESEEGTYTTVYILYRRHERLLTLETEGDGVVSFTATNADSSMPAGNVAPQVEPGQYRVIYGTSVRLNLDLNDGYKLNRFEISAVEAVGNVENLAEAIGLIAHEISDGVMGYYTSNDFTDENLVFTITEDADGYILETMPNYSVSIKALTKAINFTVQYHSNYTVTVGDEEIERVSEPETWTYNVSGSIKNITNDVFAGWGREGYDFVGWAYTTDGGVVFTFEDENDLPYNFDYETIATYNREIHLYAIWSAGEVGYTINYYQENLTTGAYDLIETVDNLQGMVGTTVSVPEQDAPNGYVLSASSTLSGVVLADGSLTLNVYYDLIESVVTITAQSDNITDITLTSNQFGFTESEFADRVITANVKFGATVTLSATANAGYILTDWRVISGGVTISDNSFTMGVANIEIEIDVVYDTFTLTFNGDGGTYESEGEQVGTPYTQDFDYMQIENLLPNRFTKEGYTFGGWSITKDTEAEIYADGDSFEYDIPRDLDATAIWTPNTDTEYEIVVSIPSVTDNSTMDVTISMTGTTDAQITEDDAWNALQEALDDFGISIDDARDGFEFDGFEEETPTIGADGETTVHSTFSRKNLTYTFRAVGTGVQNIQVSYYSVDDAETKSVTVTSENVELTDVAFGVDVTITPTFAEGYEYGLITEYRLNEESEEEAVNSWTYEQTSSGVITTNSGSESGHIFVVTAETQTYQLIYHENFKGSEVTQEVDITYLGRVTIESVFTQNGYTLTGWATSDEEPLTKVYEPTDVIEIYETAGDLHLYAMWTSNTYTIRYNAYLDESGENMDNTSAVYDEPALLNVNTYERTGYHFTGWATTEGASAVYETVGSVEDITTTAGIYYVTSKDRFYAFNLSYINEDVVNLYPAWEINTYTVVLHMDEEEGSASISLGEFDYNEDVTIPAFNTPQFTNWVREGYEFNGWYYYVGEDKTPLDATADQELTVSMLTEEDGDTIDIYVNWTEGDTTFSILLLYQRLDSSYDEEMTSEDNYTLLMKINDEPIMIETGSVVTPEQIYNTYILGNNVTTKAGFTFSASTGVQSYEIMVDGTTTVRLYFTRDMVDLYINVGTGLESAGVERTGTNHIYVGSEENGEHYRILHSASVTLTAEALIGYDNVTFTSGDIEISGTTFIMPLNEQMRVTINAYAEPNEDTHYTIEVYLADENGSYGDAPTYTTDGAGTTDTPIPTDNSAIEGMFDLSTYHFSEFDFEQTEENEDITTILGDGSSVIKFYYLRNEYSVSYEVNYASSINALPVGGRVVFGREVTATFTMQAGYTFNSVVATRQVVGEGGEPEDEVLSDFVDAHPIEEGSATYIITFTMPTHDVKISINTTANPDTEYTVVYRYENVNLATADDSYEEGEIIDLTGTTGTIITEAMIGIVDGTIESVRDGFVYSRNDLDTNTIIAGDGLTVINVYFNRIRTEMRLGYDDANEGLSNLQVKVNGVVVEGEEAEGSSGIIITTRTYSIAYGQEVEVSFDLAENFEFDGFVVTGVTEAVNPEDLQIGEYTANYTTLTYLHGLENVDINITVEAIEVNYTVRYFTQNVVSMDEVNDQVVENYSTEAVFEVTDLEYINDNITADEIRTQYIEGIADLPNYNEALFVGMNLNSYWYRATNSSGTDITSFIQVAADGSTVINIYVNRQIIDINLDLDDNFADTEENIQYVYGSEVNIVVSTDPGYDFVSLQVNGSMVESGVLVTEGLNNEEIVSYSFTISEENIVYDEETETYKIDIIMTSVAGEANYTINIYLENIELNGTSNIYGEPTVNTLTGITGTVISYEEYLTAPIGYRLYDVEISGGIDELEQPIINGNESSVVNIYFRLEVINFEIEFAEGVESFNVSSRYGSLTLMTESETSNTYTAKFGEILQNFTVVVNDQFSYDGIILAFMDETGGWLEGEIQPDSLTLSNYIYSVPAQSFKMTVTTEADEYIVYYDPNDGTAGVNDPNLYGYGDQVTILDNMFEREGYTFLGWAISPDQAELGEDGVAYRAGDVITITNYLTLYAVWEVETSNNWWLYLVIGLIILLIIIIIIIIIIVVKRKKDKEKRRMASKQ